MPDNEARDAFVGVEVDLPNGKVIRGNPVPYPAAMRLMLLSEQFYLGAPVETVTTMLTEFEQITGITQDKLLALCPDLSLGEVVNLVQRFFYWRRSAPTAPPENPPANPPRSGA